MTREEALRAETMGDAYAMFAEDILGSIEAGKLADFVVIPVDLMTIPAEGIWKIEPEMTVIGGEVVYTKPCKRRNCLSTVFLLYMSFTHGRSGWLQGR